VKIKNGNEPGGCGLVFEQDTKAASPQKSDGSASHPYLSFFEVLSVVRRGSGAFE
jgi:hypothetical protein